MDANHERRELQAFLLTCREALQPEPEAVPGQLAERILARTTRSNRITGQGAGPDNGRDTERWPHEHAGSDDPSWRGDLRLVQGFLRARWKASWLLRVAAASLVLHLGALPLLAYFGFVKEEPEFALKFAPREAPAYVETPEPEREVELDELGELPDARELPVQDGLEVQNAINWARFHLAKSAEELARAGFGARVGVGVASGAGGPEARSEVGRALIQRGSYLVRRAAEERPVAAPMAPVVTGASEAPVTVPANLERPSVARAIYAEHLLDRFVIEGRAAPGLQSLLAELGREPGAPLMRLEFCALLRARSYGLLAQDTGRRLEAVLAGPSDLPRGWTPLAPRAPLDRAYGEALVQAGGSELLQDPAGAAWVAVTTGEGTRSSGTSPGGE